MKGLERSVLFLLMGVVSCGGGQPGWGGRVLALGGVGSVEEHAAHISGSPCGQVL